MKYSKLQENYISKNKPFMAVATIKKKPIVMVFDGTDASLFDSADPEEEKKLDPNVRIQNGVNMIKNVETASWTIVHHPDEYLTEEELAKKNANISEKK